MQRLTTSVSASCFNDTATPGIYTLSLHDALPIYASIAEPAAECRADVFPDRDLRVRKSRSHLHDRKADRKSTRLNSSHGYTSYAVFCLKKKIHQQASPREQLFHPAAADCVTAKPL